MQKSNLLIVDDEPDFLEFLNEAFVDTYDVKTYESGLQGLEHCRECLPDIVLLDIGLIDMDGYEVCRQIKEIDSQDQCSIIFVSGRDSLDDRIKGYSVGADDFITKPIRLHELVAKVNKVSQFQEQKKVLCEQEKIARDMAYQAMTEASLYGNLVQFIKQVLEAKSMAVIARCVIDVVQKLSLNSCVQIRAMNTLSIRSNGKECSPIEEDLFKLLNSKGRVHSFKRRAMFNDVHLSILITNMPDDELYYGQVTDLLAIIVEVGEVAIVNIARKLTLETSLDGMNDTLGFIIESFEKQKTISRGIIRNYLLDVEENIGSLGLTEEQENFFIARAEKMEEELFAFNQSNEEIKCSLQNIIQTIKTGL